ncbi:patatin-like phospholipase family protein [Streptomyces chiangmaiensis]|uniref:Patatin-like phospholipase family protein n=1 Tax=Streptomyces chiangmaiensis TaxID=766497 RepID=A0ABU7FPJ8_9ACTN|nr:patatin-like phospholipase family protein [Streptomyces chiangmaiensis]MED7825880.1 patatin-like phospholipase family protein [Streptomyces chiangmaiensis]
MDVLGESLGMTSQAAGFGARPDPGVPRSPSGGRRGLVLGAGGSLGAAWTIGALCALEDAYGWDPRSADVILGTSAGAIVGSALALGTRPCELRDHQRGHAVAFGPLRGVRVDYDTWVGGGLPPLPKPGIGSLKLLRSMAGRPHRMPFTILLAAFAPPGRASLDGVRDVFRQLGMADRWPTTAALRVVAVDVDTGTRVLFGTPDAPRTDLATAVTASCALPAWFAPVEIDGRHYVDGCAWSDTNLDLLAGDGLDEVVVLAPTSARRTDRPRGLAARAERRLRRVATGRLLREAQQVRDAGTRVRLITPGPEDLAAMGPNLMDPLRRLTVLETSLRTTAAELRTPSPDQVATPPQAQGPTDRRPG